MTPEELDEIRKRWQMASLGPWYADHDYREGGANQVLDHNGLTVCFMAHDSSGEIDEFDTEFISHSVSDIPALLAEIERLRTALELYADPDNWDDWGDSGMHHSLKSADDGIVTNNDRLKYKPWKPAQDALKDGER
jgi:hypothetical protein